MPSDRFIPRSVIGFAYPIRKAVVQMTAQTYIRRGQQTLKRAITVSRNHWAARGGICALGGFLAAAAGLGNVAQPVSVGLICACPGWLAVAAGLGSAAGSWLFWGQAGLQGIVWSALAVLLALTLGRREEELLLSAAAGFAVSAAGLFFQLVLREETGFGLYLLRVALAAGCVWLFRRVARREDPIYDWLAEGAAMLALVQVAPLPWLSLGFAAGGLLCLGEALPGAAMAGLAMDLSGVTRVPMTAVLCLGALAKLLPIPKKWLWAAPASAYLLLMGLVGTWDLIPLPGLVAGSALALLIPGRQEIPVRRGKTGLAQVRLELMAGVLSQSRQLLLETSDPVTDIPAILSRTRERACGGCPNRKQCADVELPPDSLQRHYPDQSSLNIPCKKPGRMITELRRSQEQLRSLRADRLRREQYREAAAQQYGFLAEYLRREADELPKNGETLRRRYQAEVGVCTSGKEVANGDRCLWFSGTRCRYYILICDGMGTGLGAQDEGRTAAELLRQMLTAGLPGEFALRSLNSLCCLRGMAGASTIDLAEICLSTGRVTLYKWGAAPSWLLRRGGVEKIGTATPPPGLSVTQTRETVERLSLRKGEALILVSDGVDGEGVLRRLRIDPAEPPGEVAALLVEHGCDQSGDDGTAAVVRLRPTSVYAS